MGTKLQSLGLATAALLGGSAAPAWAGQTTGAASVITIKPLSLLNLDGLNFGNLLQPLTPGTVTIAPTTGARTVTGGVIATTGTFGPARYVGAGSRNQQVTIVLGASAIQIQRVGGTETMTVDNFTIGALAANGLAQIGAGNGPPRFRIAATDGVFTFTVGARLSVAANQAEGSYQGTYSLTVNYQ